ncbi:MAG: hypothetical protein B5M46_04930 [Epsilonproteobacteria bacterium 4484_20]|nr:MAG: hypothetical protein B5M46_04930 [Epsilonproteobacteria bacterium 4484_20]
MNLNQYRNELIVGLAFMLMLMAFFYKNAQISSQAEQLFTMKQEVRDFKEIIAYKRVWGDKGLSKKIDKLQTIVPASKLPGSVRTITWSANANGKKSLNDPLYRMVRFCALHAEEEPLLQTRRDACCTGGQDQ